MNEEEVPDSGPAFQAIRAIDYMVIFVRAMAAMRRFYEGILGFPRAFTGLDRISGERQHPRPGRARPSLTAADVPTPTGSAALQLAFKVSAAAVDQCADELVRQDIRLLSPSTDQVFGHRTLLFRDPDGNLLKVFADI